MKKNIKELLKEALSKKTCIEYAVAAVIETRDGHHILGWNGPPQGIAHTECFLKKEQGLNGQYRCPAVHSERRAISRAAKDGIETWRAAMYLIAGGGFDKIFPCADCTKSIIEAGIETLVLPDEIYLDKSKHILAPSLQNTPYNFEMSEDFLRKTGVQIIIDPTIKVHR